MLGGLKKGVGECYWCVCEIAEEEGTLEMFLRGENRGYLEEVVRAMGRHENGEWAMRIVGNFASRRQEDKIKVLIEVEGFF